MRSHRRQLRKKLPRSITAQTRPHLTPPPSKVNHRKRCAGSLVPSSPRENKKRPPATQEAEARFQQPLQCVRDRKCKKWFGIPVDM